MKKLTVIMLAVVLVLSFAACAKNAEGGAGDAMSVREVLDATLANIPDLPSLMDAELTDENFTYYTFAEPVEGAEGIVSEPMIGSIPHSVVVVRTPDAESAAALAREMRSNMDTRKWICVEAEKGVIAVHGSTVMMVMSSTAAADAAAANFDALWAK